MKTINAAILGTGKIGCDLLVKLIKSRHLECRKFIGRDKHSNGLEFAKKFGIDCADAGINSLLDNIADYDVIFDATSAAAHHEHQAILKPFNKKIINLTPDNNGTKCVPSVNLNAVSPGDNINMVTCGGQVSIPIICVIKPVVGSLDYIEVVSSISSNSAGQATRQNINDYLNTTEQAISEFSGCQNSKVILNINPAKPGISMQTTVSMLIDDYRPSDILEAIHQMIKKVREYAPHYDLVCDPVFDGKRVTVMIRVKGNGDFLPTWAGNLDIITGAAVLVAEKHT